MSDESMIDARRWKVGYEPTNLLQLQYVGNVDTNLPNEYDIPLQSPHDIMSHDTYTMIS